MANAQQDTTIKIKEFELVDFNSQLNFDLVDSMDLKALPQLDIAQILQQNAALNIRTYGNGSLSSSGIRGLGASATQISWNDIPLNSSLLGQADLSAFPMFLFDEIRIQSVYQDAHKAFGALAANLALGSNVSATQSPVINFGYGSFQSQNIGLKIPVKTKFWESVTGFSHRAAKNNFSYTDISSSKREIKTQSNADFSQYAVSHTSKIKLKNAWKLQAGLLYSDNNRSLPAVISASKSGESQSDKQLTAYLEGGKSFSSVIITNKLAYLHQSIAYGDSLKGIESLGIENRLFNLTTVKWHLSKTHQLSYAARIFVEQTENSGFSQSIQRNRTEQSLTWNFNFQSKIFTELRTALATHKGDFIPLVQGLIQAVPFDKYDFKIFSGFQQNLNVPSLNDLYWEVGGNPDLIPELSDKLEIGWFFTQAFGKHLKFSWQQSFYHQFINNKIQWQPMAGALWTANNIGSVNARGIETMFKVHLNKANWRFSIANTYSLNIAEDFRRNQLIYSPRQLNLFKFQIMHSNGFYIRHIQEYVSERFIASNNLTWLPAYYLQHLQFGKTVNWNKKVISIAANIDNLLDVEYMAIVWRPMPGRAFHVNIGLNF